MLWQVSVLHYFLWLNNIPQYGCIMFCLVINPLMDIWVVKSHLLAIVNSAVMRIYVQILFEYLFSILVGICLEVELLGHMLILCKTC